MKFKTYATVTTSICVLILLTAGCSQKSNPFSPALDAAREGDVGINSEVNTVSRGPLTPRDPLSGREARAQPLRQSFPQKTLSAEMAVLNPGSAGKPTSLDSSAPGVNRHVNHPTDKPNGAINNIRTSHGELAADILPQRWNVNWEKSEEELTVKIYGENFDSIDPESVSLSNGADFLMQTGFEWSDVCLHVNFMKFEAIGLIENPVSGTAYEMLIAGTAGGEAVQLLDTISIVGNKHLGELSAEIRPGKWNIAWTESEDDVTVKISGQGFSEVEPGTVRMTSPLGEITPHSHEVGGTYFTAFFQQKEAIGLLENPKREDQYDIGIAFTTGGVPYLMSQTITIVGSKKSGEYAVKISPAKWNLGWTDNTEELTVKISGGDPGAVDTGSITMTGPNESIISPSGTAIEDKNLLAAFIKQEAIGLIDEPEPGKEYTIKVAFTADGESFSFDYAISVTGKKK